MSWRLDRFEPLDNTGTVQLPSIRAQWDGGTGTPVKATVELPGGGGWDAWGSQIAQPGITTYKLKAELWAARGETAAQLATRLRPLYALRGKKGKLYRRWPDGKTEWTYARCQQVPSPLTNDNVLIVPVEMSFETTSPIWYANLHSQGWNWGPGSGVHFGDGHTFDEANETTLSGGSGALHLYNNGSQPVRDVELTFFSPNASGVANTITLSCPGSNCYWSYFGAFTANSQLIIDCGVPSVYLGGIADFKHFKREATHNNDYWLELLPGGDNPITVTWTGGLPQLTVRAVYSDAVE